MISTGEQMAKAPGDSKIACSFCGIPEEDAKALVKNGAVGICSDCVLLASFDIEQSEKPKASKSLNPKDLVRYLDQYVIGQPQTKKVLAVAISNHYKRIGKKLSGKVDKSNIWLIGPTGSGKTMLLQTLANYVDVPFASIDSTTITEAGYVGEDPDSVISKLLISAEGNIQAAEHGIVFVDEFDKLAKSHNFGHRDIKGAGCQQAFLKMIEGDVVAVNPTGRKKNSQDPVEYVNTKNILFILGGAFVGLDANKSKKHIGIGKESEKYIKTEIKPADLVAYGMIEEIVGRVPIIAETDLLDEAQLVRILTEPRNSITRQYEMLLLEDDIVLEFSQEFLQAVAKMAIKDETGARGLRAVLEKAMLDVMYEAKSTPDGEKTEAKGRKKIVITPDFLK